MEYFGAAEAEDEGGAFKGWAYVAWSKPEGAKLEAIAERLKALKLTIRNAPLDQEAGPGRMPVHGGSGTGVRADRARLLGTDGAGEAVRAALKTAVTGASLHNAIWPDCGGSSAPAEEDRGELLSGL